MMMMERMNDVRMKAMAQSDTERGCEGPATRRDRVVTRDGTEARGLPAQHKPSVSVAATRSIDAWVWPLGRPSGARRPL